MSKISQREARRLRREVKRLEEVIREQRRYWATEWPNSTVLGRLAVPSETQAMVRTARILKHAVVVTLEGENLKFFGLELPK